MTIRTPAVSPHIPRLDPGEDAAIRLAEELHADAVLLDDGPARKIATARGLHVIGLLGILDRADERGLVRLPELAARFPADYRIDQTLVDIAVQRSHARRVLP